MRGVKPLLTRLPELAVARLVHGHDRDQLLGLRPHALAGAEELGVLRDVDDVGVLRDDPEVVPLVPVERRVPPKPGVRRMRVAEVELGVEDVGGIDGSLLAVCVMGDLASGRCSRRD